MDFTKANYSYTLTIYDVYKAYVYAFKYIACVNQRIRYISSSGDAHIIDNIQYGESPVSGGTKIPAEYCQGVSDFTSIDSAKYTITNNGDLNSISPYNKVFVSLPPKPKDNVTYLVDITGKNIKYQKLSPDVLNSDPYLAMAMEFSILNGFLPYGTVYTHYAIDKENGWFSFASFPEHSDNLYYGGSTSTVYKYKKALIKNGSFEYYRMNYTTNVMGTPLDDNNDGEDYTTGYWKDESILKIGSGMKYFIYESFLFSSSGDILEYDYYREQVEGTVGENFTSVKDDIASRGLNRYFFDDLNNSVGSFDSICFYTQSKYNYRDGEILIDEIPR
jgi:hypothetical protein